MIKFDFSGQGISQEELAKIEEETSGFKSFKPGEAEVEIVHVKYTGAAEKDPTWHKMQLVYSTPGAKAVVNGEGKVNCGDDPCIYKTILFPVTSKVLYNEDNSKRPTAVFAFLRDFMVGLGVSLTPENMKEIIPQYFSNETALFGKKQKVVLGFDGPHALEVGGVFQLVDKKGKPILDKTFGTKALVESQALILGIDKQYQRRVSILGYIPAEAQGDTTNAASNEWDD